MRAAATDGVADLFDRDTGEIASSIAMLQYQYCNIAILVRTRVRTRVHVYHGTYSYTRVLKYVHVYVHVYF
jgi:hypothetical protein